MVVVLQVAAQCQSEVGPLLIAIVSSTIALVGAIVGVTLTHVLALRREASVQERTKLEMDAVLARDLLKSILQFLDRALATRQPGLISRDQKLEIVLSYNEISVKTIGIRNPVLREHVALLNRLLLQALRAGLEDRAVSLVRLVAGSSLGAAMRSEPIPNETPDLQELGRIDREIEDLYNLAEREPPNPNQTAP